MSKKGKSYTSKEKPFLSEEQKEARVRQKTFFCPNKSYIKKI
jgi:hypothetical protein